MARLTQVGMEVMVAMMEMSRTVAYHQYSAGKIITRHKKKEISIRKPLTT